MKSVVERLRAKSRTANDITYNGPWYDANMKDIQHIRVDDALEVFEAYLQDLFSDFPELPHRKYTGNELNDLADFWSDAQEWKEKALEGPKSCRKNGT